MKLPFLLELPGSDSVVFAVGPAFYYLTFAGAIVLVAIGLFFWAVAIRKPRKRKHRHHWRTSSRKNAPPESVEPKSSGRRRRSEPPRNPTLAETRGLPPLRDGHSDSTQHYQH